MLHRWEPGSVPGVPFGVPWPWVEAPALAHWDQRAAPDEGVRPPMTVTGGAT